MPKIDRRGKQMVVSGYGEISFSKNENMIHYTSDKLAVAVEGFTLIRIDRTLKSKLKALWRLWKWMRDAKGIPGKGVGLKVDIEQPVTFNNVLFEKDKKFFDGYKPKGFFDTDN